MSQQPALLPQSLRRQIPDLYAQEHKLDPIAYTKIYTPNAGWTWFVLEFDPRNELCYGYVDVNGEGELGYFSLRELQDIRVPLEITEINASTRVVSHTTVNLPLLRDTHFKPTPLSQAKAQLHRENGYTQY